MELIDSGTKSENLEKNLFNIDAEIALIGCLLWDNKHYEKVSEFLKEEHFVDENNRKIYKTIASLLDKNILVPLLLLVIILMMKLIIILIILIKLKIALLQLKIPTIMEKLFMIYT